jgi:hypothetical protein
VRGLGVLGSLPAVISGIKWNLRSEIGTEIREKATSKPKLDFRESYMSY